MELLGSLIRSSESLGWAVLVKVGVIVVEIVVIVVEVGVLVVEVVRDLVASTQERTAWAAWQCLELEFHLTVYPSSWGGAVVTSS